MSVTNPHKRKTSHVSNSASRTPHNCGIAIHRAVLAQQRADLRDYPNKGRRTRTEEEWREEYEKAMADKRTRSE